MRIIHTPALVSLALVGALALSACGGSESSGASDEQICADVQRLGDAVDAMDGATTQEEAFDLLDGTAEAAGDMVESAPDEIKADVELLAEGFRALADAGDGESAAAVLDGLDEEALSAAGDNFEQFANDTCDIEL